MKITLPILLTAFLISTSSILFAKSITNNTARGIAKDQQSTIINRNSENDFGLSDISLGTLAGEPFTADNTITLTSGFGTQTLCINGPITTITYVTTGATGATVTGLPTGVTGSWAGNVVTISGSPSVSGKFNYTVTLTGGSGNVTATDTITVSPNGTVTQTSSAGTANQIIHINTAITPITYATTNATGTIVSGLPEGVTGTWAANILTISGTLTIAQPTYTYTVSLTGACGNATSSGTMKMTADNTITRTSAAGTDAQTLCVNTAITPITYATTGAAGATFSNLPAGVTGSWAGNVVTISGTPTSAGTFNYTVTLTGGSGNITSTGTITVTSSGTITRTSATGTQNQNIFISTPITNITYATYNATGATVSGLPAGVTGNWVGSFAAGVLTISGTPKVAQPLNTYIISLTGACGSAIGSGTITVTGMPVITADYCSIRPKVRLTTGTYSSYLWSNGATTKSIDVDVAGNYTVTVSDATGNSGSSTIQIADELIVNGSFSAGNSSFSSGYTYFADIAGNNELFPDNGTNGYAVGTNGQNYHPNFYGFDHTNNATGARNFMIVNGHGTITVWQQTVTLSPNTDYYFSAWAMSLNDSPPFARLQFEVNGTLVGTVANLTAGPANAAQAATNNYWTRFYSNPLWNSGASTTATIRIVNLENALGGNDFGLDDISFGTLASVPLTVNPASSSSNNSATTIYSGQTLNLTSSVSGGKAPIVYSWTGPNGFTSTAANPTILNATVANAGTYTLQCADYYGCNPITATTNVIISQTMRTTDLPESGLRIYPNPTTGIINIAGLQPDKKTKIEVFTVDGKSITKKTSNSSAYTIDISNEISGTYLIVVNKQKIKIVKK